jgi:hypothetical protein
LHFLFLILSSHAAVKGAVYHIGRSIARNSRKLHCVEFMQSRRALMPGSQVALRSQALVTTMAFAHHAAQ